MIRVRLRELIEEYGSSISEISESTGINRASLTQIAENKSKMVKFDTLDKLKLFFQMDDIYELFIDDDSAVISVRPHKLKDNQLFLDFIVNVQLSRDSKSVKKQFSVLLKMHIISPKTYLFTGSIVSQKEITNFDAVRNIFSNLHPVTIQNFFDRLSTQFLQDAYYKNGLSDTDNGGIFPTEIAKSIVQNQAQLIFSIPDLDLISTLMCEHYVVPDEYEEINFLTVPDMSHKFPDYESQSEPVTIKLFRLA